MKDFGTQKSRQQNNPNRYQRKGILPERRKNFSTLLSLLVLLPAFVLISCRKSPVPGIPAELPAVDSTITTVMIRNGSGFPAKNLQLLVYDCEGTQSLEALLRFSEVPDSVEILLPEGEKLIAAVANMPKSLSPVSLARYGSLDELGYDFSDEDPEFPILSGVGATVGQTGEILLGPLLCSVEISAISNSMDNYELVENPRVRLANINSYAGIMQTEDFYPTEIIDYGEWTCLPYDIGMFTQHPGTVLHCYPNETAESSISGLRTSLELQCEILGKTCTFETALPPFGRDSRVLVEMTVNGPDSFNSSVRVEKQEKPVGSPAE